MRKLALAALVALLTLVPVSAATAKTKTQGFAAKHRLKGAWKSKDADKDGLKNLKEFKLGTNPRKADSDADGLKDGDELRSGNHPLKADTDRDGVKDGLEHAGTITAFDGVTIAIREFATGRTLTATLDTECTPAYTDEVEEEDPFADDSAFDEEEEGELFRQDEEDDLGDEDVACDDDDALAKGVVLQSAEIEGGHLTAYVVA